MDDNGSDLLWYVGLYLCDLFYEKFRRYSGELITGQGQLEINLDNLKLVNKSLSNKYLINSNKQDIPDELYRYGASELHSISAFIDGCCTQEAIKLITHQYIPFDNTLFIMEFNNQ